MVQESRPGSFEQNLNCIVLPPPWQKSIISLRTIDNKNINKRKLETTRTNTNANQNEQPISGVTTYNRYSILESTNDSMDFADSPIN